MERAEVARDAIKAAAADNKALALRRQTLVASIVQLALLYELGLAANVEIVRP